MPYYTVYGEISFSFATRVKAASEKEALRLVREDDDVAAEIEYDNRLRYAELSELSAELDEDQED